MPAIDMTYGAYGQAPLYPGGKLLTYSVAGPRDEELPAYDAPQTNVIFRCTLTGAPDGLADLDLSTRMTSFQGRIRTGEATYLAVVIGNAGSVIDSINSRPNGEIVIDRAETATGQAFSAAAWNEIARADFETATPSEGTRSHSAVLSGHQTETYDDPITRALTGARLLQTTGGLKRYRCRLDNILRPGDVATWVGESLTVGEIAYTVGPTQQYMDVFEAES